MPHLHQVPEQRMDQFLARSRLRALETYWYFRLIETTPHVFDLDRRLLEARRSAAVTRADIAGNDRNEEPTSTKGRQAMALSRFARLNAEQLQHQLIFADRALASGDLMPVRRFVRET